jgi:hypothetical protein
MADVPRSLKDAEGGERAARAGREREENGAARSVRQASPTHVFPLVEGRGVPFLRLRSPLRSGRPPWRRGLKWLANAVSSGERSSRPLASGSSNEGRGACPRMGPPGRRRTGRDVTRARHIDVSGSSCSRGMLAVRSRRARSAIAPRASAWSARAEQCRIGLWVFPPMMRGPTTCELARRR